MVHGCTVYESKDGEVVHGCTVYESKDGAEVIEAKVTFGLYDIVCKIEAPSMKSIKDIIINDIRGISLVKETQTLPLF